MPKQSAFLRKQMEIEQESMRVAERITRQMMMDTLEIMLRDNLKWGFKRIKRFIDGWCDKYNSYYDAVLGGPEADVLQEKLDEELKEFIKDNMEFIPFSERYPEVKTRSLEKKADKRRKEKYGW